MKTEYLKDWEQDMNRCIRCAYCFEGCPVFKDLKWESDGARGKVILSYGLFTGQLEASKHIADKIYQCTYCKDCIERCSADVSIPDILTAARADLVKAGYGYKQHRELLKKITQTGNIFGKEIKPPFQNGETPVLLGCRFLERSDDVIKYLEILKKLGIQPKVVDETCCGMPFAVLGYKDQLSSHKEEFCRAFPYENFICLCTTCAFFIKKAYPNLKPKYVIETIVEKLPNHNPKNLGLEVTYHDPCNVARGMGMVDEPRAILKKIGVKVVEMATNGKEAECCGGGGGLLVTDKSLAERMAEKRVNQALEIGVDTLVTLCPTCEVNIRNVANKNGGKLKVKNVLDLVWDAICH
jgi:fumarate reductase (CoM/CoB) subunit B